MYTIHDRVSYSRIDRDGLMGISNVVDCLQDCCMFHSEDAGHSALELLKKDRAWLVSSWHVVFRRRPTLGEYISIHTWPYQFKGIFGSRNFLMETPEHEVLAYADSRWFYFDSAAGRPARIDREEIEVYPTEPPYEMEHAPRKVNCPEDMELKQVIEVSPNYLDTNDHVNNGQYVRLAANALPMDYPVKQLRAEFRLAAKLGNTLHLRTAVTEDRFYATLTDREGEPYFLCEFL
ncbi:MAG: acyl-[acyl-carrier-protein] thioesterase [Eubacterium sp.]|nr:acyl-[acyl-carrier-protein] thioesterase [Eubacterium sp.]